MFKCLTLVKSGDTQKSKRKFFLQNNEPLNYFLKCQDHESQGKTKKLFGIKGTFGGMKTNCQV